MGASAGFGSYIREFVVMLAFTAFLISLIVVGLLDG